MEDATAWRKLNGVYEVIFIRSDPRVNQWFLLSSEWTPIVIFIAYLIFVFRGPKYMERRPPYKLKNILLVYNAFQVFMSLYIFQEGFRTAMRGEINLICESFETRADPIAMRLLSTGWLFYVSKIIDLLDTVFFIMKKKDNQVTFLHVFHHSTMVINTWIGLRHVIGGSVLIPCLLNSVVHVFMYSYYFLAALGPEVQKYLWWKKYLTQLQLVQFMLVIIHMCMNIYKSCPGPVWLQVYGVFYVVSIAFLFINYYVQTYNKARISKIHSKDGYVSKNKVQNDFINANGVERKLKTTTNGKSKSL